ncbi:aromatic amino acid DMT transporter YddG [Cronobacter sakazakii]|uniref:aromatic amino acid DMT transporter YddG n=1 Tax=Cronobacter sakazakii TaxID=28141 RepID=UPI000CFAD8C1|nr:aromatic amino acid DMT transporter YddG [Cronobacter sakazakii]EKK3975417.1 aromatic amino acid DMT transporter YddG [Cronobacter sakazakii]EKY1981100.1 aromatic amino acid DMT transporter YddG [Cronobacter sakazakii]EKY1998682.1 aromatic amino acid DMT transporter YddG [Cronobacter sakazakii]ELY3756327.1 aromatic amino acid DMT transporter YddG [Cronobacter sakazakii]ELY5987033.1 aromatic amino acid DMT transporter YddG [Cronobacter sakazakii]
MSVSTQRATLPGLLAILLWSTSVGLLRSISEAFGSVGGAALIYTVSSLCLMMSPGLVHPGRLPRRYLIIGGALFVGYEICLALAIGLAHTRAQSLELGMINYLWPSLTVLLAVLINGQRCRVWLWPGLLLAVAGVFQVLKGDGGWSPAQLWLNMQDNPPAYGLAFSAALVWALYCNLTRRWSNGQNGVALFFCATAAVLWLQYSLAPQPPMQLSLPAVAQLLFMGLSTAAAYAAWNYSIQHGNMTLLATASYFTPVLSALLASLWLGLAPGIAFWQGVAMVVAGSLLCWLATRNLN